MTKQTTATADQMDSIRARRVDDSTRKMMETGGRLTWEQADEIGDEGSHWLRERLGLSTETDDTGVLYTPTT